MGRPPGLSVDPTPAPPSPVVVWVAPLDPPPPVAERLTAWLDDAELARARLLPTSVHARRAAVSRGWLRAVLGHALGRDPASVRFTPGPGKPALAGGDGPCFSSSRRGALALLATAPHPVGVDVERVGGDAPTLSMLELTCTPGEAAALAGRPPAERGDAFLALWTAKEAYLKALGTGLAVAPALVEIGAAATAPGGPVAMVGDPGPPRWWVRPLAPAPGYVGAVAAEGSAWTVHLDDARRLVDAGPATAGR